MASCKPEVLDPGRRKPDVMFVWAKWRPQGNCPLVPLTRTAGWPFNRRISVNQDRALVPLPVRTFRVSAFVVTAFMRSGLQDRMNAVTTSVMDWETAPPVRAFSATGLDA